MFQYLMTETPMELAFLHWQNWGRQQAGSRQFFQPNMTDGNQGHNHTHPQQKPKEMMTKSIELRFKRSL